MKKWQYYAFANVLWLLNIPFSMSYYNRLLASGTLPTDGDSISIPIGENIIGTAILLPLVNLLLWLYFKWLPQKVTLLICFLVVLLSTFYHVRDPLPAWEWVFGNILWVVLFVLLWRRKNV